jgi:hypothetical protein
MSCFIRKSGIKFNQTACSFIALKRIKFPQKRKEKKRKEKTRKEKKRKEKERQDWSDCEL